MLLSAHETLFPLKSPLCPPWWNLLTDQALMPLQKRTKKPLSTADNVHRMDVSHKLKDLASTSHKNDMSQRDFHYI